MNAFVTHFAIDFRIGIRNKTLMLMNYLFPLGFYLAMGLIMTQINPMFGDTLIPSMVVFSILVSTTLGLPTPIIADREAGIFRTYKINGVPSQTILLIPALTTLLHSFIVGAIITLTGAPLFGGPLPVNWGGFLLSFFAMAFASTGLGVLIGVVCESSRTTVLWQQLIFLPSMLLGGLMVPLSMLPAGPARIAMLLPATHAMNVLNQLAYGMTGGFSVTVSLVSLFVGGLLAFGLADYLFSWDSRNARRRASTRWGFLALLPYVLAALLVG